MKFTVSKAFIFNFVIILTSSLVKSDDENMQRCFKGCNDNTDICLQDSRMKNSCGNMPYDKTQTYDTSNCTCDYIDAKGNRYSQKPPTAWVKQCNCTTSTICSKSNLTCPANCNSKTDCGGGDGSCTSDKFGDSPYNFTFACGGNAAFILQANKNTPDDCRISAEDLNSTYSSCYCYRTVTCNLFKLFLDGTSSGGILGTGSGTSTPDSTVPIGMCYRCDIRYVKDNNFFIIQRMGIG